MEHMNSLGNRSDRNISIKYRSCHPSYISRLDLNSCSSSSPGLSGVVSPFTKTDKLWFNAKTECENTEYEMYCAEQEYLDKHDNDKLRIKFTTSSPEAYYDAKLKVRDALNKCELIIPETEYDDMSKYYPENPNGPLKIQLGVRYEEMMKPVIL